VCYKKYFANNLSKCAFYCGFEEVEWVLKAPSLINNHPNEIPRTTTIDETISNKNSSIPDMPQNQILSEIAQGLLTDALRE